MSAGLLGAVFLAPMDDHANAVVAMARDVASGSTAQDHMLAQIGLSIALQGGLNSAIQRGDLSNEDVVQAFGSAFGSWVAQQGGCLGWCAGKAEALATAVRETAALVAGEEGRQMRSGR